MNARYFLAIATLTAGTMLTACGGGGGAAGSLPSTGGNNTQSAAQQTEDSINTANDVGSPLKDISSYNEATSSPSAGGGTCNNGVEFFAPDKKGDPNSTERIDFYDNACTAPARDAVRIWTSTGSSSETV